MNSFQSLLDSYNKLRKRTYALTSILAEVGPSNRAIGTIPPTEGKKIRLAFASQTGYREEAGALVNAFKSAQKLPEGVEIPESGLFVGLSKDGTSYNFRSSGGTSTSNLPATGQWLNWIIEYLSNADADQEKPGASHHSIDDAATAGTLTDENGNPIDEEDARRAAETAARNHELERKLGKLVGLGVIPNPETADSYALIAPTQIYPKTNIFNTFRSILSKVGWVLFGLPSPSPERIYEATKELQEDTLEMLDYFEKNHEELDRALAEDGCVHADENLNKLRDRFFLGNTTGSNFALCYGNYQGQAEDPCRFSGIVNETSSEDLEDYHKKEQGTSGHKTAKKLWEGDSNSLALGKSLPRDGGTLNSTNPLHQLISKYKDVKICKPNGENSKEPLFKVDHISSSGNLVSTISENSAVISTQLLKIVHLRSQERFEEADALDAQLKEVVDLIIKECEKSEKALDDLARNVEGFERHNKGNMNNKSAALQAVFEDREGTNYGEELVGSKFSTSSKKCKEVTLETIKRELNENPIHNAVQARLEAGEFKGNFEITSTHPNGQPVNKMVGLKEPHEGVHDVLYPTRCTPDTLFVCDNREDMEHMLLSLEVPLDSEDAILALTPQKSLENENGVFILPISDKMYRNDGSTNQGNLDVKHLRNEAFVDRSIQENLAGIPSGPERRELTAAGKESIKNYIAATDAALLMIADPSILDQNSNSAEIKVAAKAERAKLVASLKASLKGKVGSKSYKMAESILSQLKDIDSLIGDPTYKTKAQSLADSVAEWSEQSEIDKLSQPDKISPKDQKKIQRLEAGRQVRRSLSSTGSGPGVVVTKFSDSSKSKVVTNRTIRNNGALKALLKLRGNTEKSQDLNLDQSSKETTRSRSYKNGNLAKQATTSINSGNLIEGKEDVMEALMS
tara:strand:- start:356 stop:3094 length:2739 start_codon:yes stop_codon:yes gene_type:complete